MPSPTSQLIAIVLGWLMLAGPAYADAYTSKEWGFSATFPGPAKQTAQPVTTAVGNVTMVSVSYRSDNTGYMISIGDFPKGTVTSRPLAQVYENTANGEAKSVKGTIRKKANFTVDGVVGRDVLIDFASNSKAAHTRIFIVGDRQFQVMFIGPSGSENGKIALDFLNSFHLVR